MYVPSLLFRDSDAVEVLICGRAGKVWPYRGDASSPGLYKGVDCVSDRDGCALPRKHVQFRNGIRADRVL